MININDLINQHMNQDDGQNQGQIHIPVEKLDLFIDRCISEKGYTCKILGIEIQQGLKADGMHNMIEDQIYPLILQRLIARIKAGEE